MPLLLRLAFGEEDSWEIVVCETENIIMRKDENYHRAGRAMLPCDVTVAHLFFFFF
jgi:hypothetical protein